MKSRSTDRAAFCVSVPHRQEVITPFRVFAGGTYNGQPRSAFAHDGLQ